MLSTYVSTPWYRLCMPELYELLIFQRKNAPSYLVFSTFQQPTNATCPYSAPKSSRALRHLKTQPTPSVLFGYS